MTDIDMTCADVERLLDQYHSGKLDDATSARLEQHASTCSVCEARVELVMRASSNRAVEALRARGERAQLPAGARAHVMETIRTGVQPALISEQTDILATRKRQTRRSLSRWGGALATLTAAAAVLMISTRKEAQPIVNATGSAATTPALETSEKGPTATAARLADDEARSEFVELDVASKELEAELAKTPDDRDLRAYLSTVRARRDELQRRVKDATS